MISAATGEPTENAGTYGTEREFIISILMGRRPTMIFRNNGQKIKLIDLFPLHFPYGWGGPDERRNTGVSQIEILQHYRRIALLQM